MAISVYVQMSHKDLWKPNYNDSGYLAFGKYTSSVKILCNCGPCATHRPVAVEIVAHRPSISTTLFLDLTIDIPVKEDLISRYPFVLKIHLCLLLLPQRNRELFRHYFTYPFAGHAMHLRGLGVGKLKCFA